MKAFLRSHSLRKLLVYGLAALAFLSGMALTAQAQDVGSVTGTVVDQASMQPLNGAQVSIEGTTQGGLTDARGRFLIIGVPEGEYTVRVHFIGYRQASQVVTVSSAQTASVDFALGISAVALEEVVVTGTGGSVARRELGTSVGSLDVSQVTEVTPVESVARLLAGRIPGVRSVAPGNGIGASGDLRIRGVNSASLNQRPVVYIDGVRVDNSAEEWAGGVVDGGTCCAFSGGAAQDRLSDLNPAEIDRIEVLKGAAAATLYGSEASNGVIQIFTKRGRSNSAPSFTMGLQTGFNRHRENFSTKLYPNFTGPDGFQALDANEALIENGMILSGDLTVQGGGEDVTYFLSGGYHHEEGSIQPNSQDRGNLRMNLRWVPNDEWTFALNSAYARNRILALQGGNNWMSLYGNAVLGNPTRATEERPFGEPWVAVPDIRDVETYSDASRWTGGFTATYRPVDFWSHKLTLGLDHTDDQKSRFLPFGRFFVYLGEGGEKNVGYRRSKNLTLDYLGQLNFALNDRFDTDFSYGAQGYWETIETSIAWGQDFAGEGVSTIGAASNTFGDESFSEEVTAGVFANGRFGYDDKLFFDVGARLDGHSAFGENYGLQFYPKAGVSYVASEDAWVPDFLSTLRLRGAIGVAGLPPGAFDQFRTFEPTPVLEDLPGVLPDDPGNPDLEPEKTTEIEGGFDVGLFNDRLGTEFTYYYNVTRDALLGISLPSSSGFLDNQLQNVGEIKNQGWELMVNATPVVSGDFRWSVVVSLSGNKNEIVDLGPTAVDGQLGAFREGYPVDAIFAREITGYDPATNTHARSDTSVYWGPPLPTTMGSVSNVFSLGDFQLYGMVSGQRGAWFNNGDRPYRIRQGAGDEYLATLDASGAPTARTDSLVDRFTRAGSIDKRDQLRLQELSLVYNLPESLSAALGMGSTQITFSGYNLHWWDDCNCEDPNIQYEGGDYDNFSGFLGTPQARRFLFSIRTRF